MMSKQAQAIRFAAPALHDGGNPSTMLGAAKGGPESPKFPIFEDLAR